MERIAVAMSGGVDSSVAAWLLKEEGCAPVGVTLRLFNPEDLAPGQEGACRALEDLADARAVAAHLGIPHHTLDLRDTFRQEVMDPFVHAYEQGRTPNPCVTCNRSIKFGAMLDQALALGCEGLATDHYARVEQDPQTGRYLLKKAAYPEKDQSYVLWSLTQPQLSRVRFPLGEMTKDQIRAIALEQGLVSARKRDSQDICFVPDGDYGSFIRRHTGRDYPQGPFCSPQGDVLGTHSGIISYTLGQRRGLGVSSNQGRLYVTRICPENNTVVLSGNQDLFHSSLLAGELNLISVERLEAPMRVWAKVRYRMEPQPAWLEQTGPHEARVSFDQPQRAITPGQSVVFYQGDLVVGGAVIQKTETM